MKIGLRSDNGAEERLRFARQVGADGASIWAAACPGYTERCYLTPDTTLDLLATAIGRNAAAPGRWATSGV
jgi:hypothetical protein